MPWQPLPRGPSRPSRWPLLHLAWVSISPCRLILTLSHSPLGILYALSPPASHAVPPLPSLGRSTPPSPPKPLFLSIRLEPFVLPRPSCPPSKTLLLSATGLLSCLPPHPPLPSSSHACCASLRHPTEAHHACQDVPPSCRGVCLRSTCRPNGQHKHRRPGSSPRRVVVEPQRRLRGQ